jgi:DNA-binding SARP family transcriptional activator
MKFRLLGPMEVVNGASELVPTAPKLRAVLALLVLRHGRLVQINELIDELWGEEPPVSALPTVQTYIYKLRKIFSSGGFGEDMLLTKPYGYVLNASPEDVDVARFETLGDEGRLALEASDPERASLLLSQALSLWRGHALADVGAGGILSAQVTRLEEKRLRALELRLDADLALGRHQTLISELKALTPEHPLHEGFHAKLMIALHRSGRRCEALEIYRRLRGVLIEELGLEPSAKLRELHQALLASDPSLDPVPRRDTEAARPPAVAKRRLPALPGRPVPPRLAAATPDSLPPSQLPPDVLDFGGRRTYLTSLEHLLTPENRSVPAVRTVSITGAPGIGKTALAIHAAHRLAPRFRHGQLFADLRGSSGNPEDPCAVLGRFLRAYGVPAAQIPPEPWERSKLFRTWSAGRDVLILLDDAITPAQFAPLIPGNADCVVIVTTRAHSLPGTLPVPLSLMSQEEGLEVLENIVGHSRAAADPAAAAEIVRLCGGLPLAIRAAGTRLAASPNWPLRKLARQLGPAGTRMDQLRIGDLDVRAQYDASYQHLSTAERSAFRLLSLLKMPVFTSTQASELLGCAADVAERLLDRLVEHHLLTVVGHNGGTALRYSLPELTRLFARERLLHLIGEPPATLPSGGFMAGAFDLANPDNAVTLTLSHGRRQGPGGHS